MGRYTVSGSGARCKRVVNDSGGSTPSLPTINQKYSKLVTGYKILKNRCAIWTEVKGPPYASMAQLAAQLTCNQ